MDKSTERAERNMLDRHTEKIRDAVRNIQRLLPLVMRDIEADQSGAYYGRPLLAYAQIIVTRSEIIDNLRELSAIYITDETDTKNSAGNTGQCDYLSPLGYRCISPIKGHIHD